MEKTTNNGNPNLASELVVGVDIGTTKIAAIVGRKNEFGKIEILGIGKSESLGVNRGVVVNIEQTVGSIKAAVSMAADKASEAFPGKMAKVRPLCEAMQSFRCRLTRQSDSFCPF